MAVLNRKAPFLATAFDPLGTCGQVARAPSVTPNLVLATYAEPDVPALVMGNFLNKDIHPTAGFLARDYTGSKDCFGHHGRQLPQVRRLRPLRHYGRRHGVPRHSRCHQFCSTW